MSSDTWHDDTCHDACVMSDTWHEDLCHSDTCRTHGMCQVHAKGG